MDPYLEGTLRWSLLHSDDVSGVTELREAIDYLDDAVDPVDRDGFGELLRRLIPAGAELSPDAVVGRDRVGTIVAFGANVLREAPSGQVQCTLEGGVHPASRHHGLGRRILAWQLARLHEWAAAQADAGRVPVRVWAGNYVDEKVTSRAAAYREAGLMPEHWFFDLRAHLPAHAPRVDHVRTPQGTVTLHLLAPRFETQVRDLHNEVFGGRYGTPEVSAAEFRASLERDGARPDWSWVALLDGAVVGYALNSAYYPEGDGGPCEGWTDRIGVAHSVRGAGIGRALLTASQGSFVRAGLLDAGAGIDLRDPESGLGAFEATGYQVSEQVSLCSTQLTCHPDGPAQWEAPGRLS